MARNANHSRNNATREVKGPSYIAYSVQEKGEGKDRSAFWTRIGAAWDHEDGNGLTLQLDLVPVNGGRIVLRTPSENNEGKGA
jgi:hypothetical protein